jgi:transglutaminase-like putative cysteine protease
MRRFVHEYIDGKGLDVGFATASEVARQRQGDCTEHGVLLAAMLRADGIPARVAGGLVYIDRFEGRRGIFGYHMWAQALLETADGPAWTDLDGALSETAASDATHIALAVSPLADGDTQGVFMSIVALLGRVQIRVESYE